MQEDRGPDFDPVPLQPKQLAQLLGLINISNNNNNNNNNSNSNSSSSSSSKTSTTATATPTSAKKPQLIETLQGYSSDKVRVVDVRGEDREHGWIPDSLHIPSSSIDDDLLEGLLIDEAKGGTCMLVFHCMFSQVRGPRAAMWCQDVRKDLFQQAAATAKRQQQPAHVTTSAAAAKSVTSLSSSSVARLPRVALLVGGFVAWENYWVSNAAHFGEDVEKFLEH